MQKVQAQKIRSQYFHRGLIILIGLTFIVSAVFLLAPQWDIYLSGLFADGKNGFPLDDNAFLESLRWLYMIEVAILCVVPTYMLFFARIKADIVRIPAQFWGFLIGSFFLGPLVLVNLIFKSNWGRPRPAQIEEFGGPWQFTPPYYISDQCQLNCSFVSGEGSAIATGGILLGFIFWHMAPKTRTFMIPAITVFSAFGIALRYVKGRHFMSDSLLAILFCAVIILLLHRLLNLSRTHEHLTFKNLKHDLLSAAKSLSGFQQR